MDRIAKVFFNKRLAGILKQTEAGYSFTYDLSYLVVGPPLSFNLPLQEQPFKSTQLFSFFDNLASEGWLKQIQCLTQKIDNNDTFGLLLENGKDLLGAVSILKNHEKDHEGVLQNQSKTG